MFLAGMHNGISRLYETFGNGGADTEKRVLSPDQYSRTWYRPNPPYPTVLWSQRDNNNYEQTALLSTLSYFAHNAQVFLAQLLFEKQALGGEARQCRPCRLRARARRPVFNRQMQLLKVLALHSMSRYSA